MENTLYIKKCLFLVRCAVHNALIEKGADVSRVDFGHTLTRDQAEALRLDLEQAAAGQSGLPYLFERFSCDDFERRAVMAALYAEACGESSEVFALLNNDWHKPYPTPESLCALYSPDGSLADYSRYFSADGCLARFFFREREYNAHTRVQLDARITDCALNGVNPYYYEETAAFYQPDTSQRSPTDEQTARRLISYIRQSLPDEGHTVFNLVGSEGSGRKSCARFIAESLGWSLLFIDMRRLLACADCRLLIDRLLRELIILQGVPVLLWPEDAATKNTEADVEYLTHRMAETSLSFVISETRISCARFPADASVIYAQPGRYSFAQSAQIWTAESRRYAVDPSLNMPEFASKFHMTPGKIKESFRAAGVFSRMAGSDVISAEDLKNGCYNSLEAVMNSKAVRIEAVYGWDELVLPLPQKQMLMSSCNQVRYKYQVYQNWGFDKKVAYGRGTSMIFSGPPGTGKTMAAQVVARELGLNLYKIELSTVVSKYVGETEKNLNELFEEAKKSQIVLFFDEADVLFSKRTEVKESNDKYSNMEAAFLLQKMEEYDGITILATNFIQNFDEAFKRRVKFLIEFPFPGTEERREIWRKAFPAELPLGELDMEYLAGFELSGSNIRNIALHSAFLAAAEHAPQIGMKHIVAAVKNEYRKSGKIFTREDAGEYFVLL